MAQLLVRGLEESLVLKLKRRASAHGVSVEEEHRRILREALSRLVNHKPSMMEFLLSAEATVHPETELDTSRAADAGSQREVRF